MTIVIRDAGVVPAQSGVVRVYDPSHLVDAFAIRLPAGASRDPETLARFIVAHQPAWIDRLTSVECSKTTLLALKATSPYTGPT